MVAHYGISEQPTAVGRRLQTPSRNSPTAELAPLDKEGERETDDGGEHARHRTRSPTRSRRGRQGSGSCGWRLESRIGVGSMVTSGSTSHQHALENTESPRPRPGRRHNIFWQVISGNVSPRRGRPTHAAPRAAPPTMPESGTAQRAGGAEIGRDVPQVDSSPPAEALLGRETLEVTDTDSRA